MASRVLAILASQLLQELQLQQQKTTTFTPLKLNMFPKKGTILISNYIFQPLIFKGHVSFRGSILYNYNPTENELSCPQQKGNSFEKEMNYLNQPLIFRLIFRKYSNKREVKQKNNNLGSTLQPYTSWYMMVNSC